MQVSFGRLGSPEMGALVLGVLDKRKLLPVGTELDQNGDGVMQKGDGGRMGAHGCSRTCCQTEACTHWQELPDRGCYHNNKETPNVHCETYTGNFIGGRKCFKKYCGGKETEGSPSWPMQGPFPSNWGQGDRK